MRVQENVNVLSINMEDFQKARLEICQACPIYNVTQEKCSSILYLNPETNEVSVIKREGFIKGCSCYIPTKIKRESNHCPANKW